MNTNIYWIVAIVVLVAVVVFTGMKSGNDIGTSPQTAISTSSPSANQDGQNAKPVSVTAINHATAVLRWGEKTLYTDPTGSSTKFSGTPAANIILITDIHADHLSTSTLTALGGTATIVVPQAVMDLLPQNLKVRARVLKNNETITEQGFKITGVPMYNVPEATDARHTRERGNGYIVEQEQFKVYIAGDTDNTPEMRALTDIDIAFVPMNPPFTMNVEQAAAAVLAFKPRQVYPYHYRGQNGLNDIHKFKQLVDEGGQDIDVVLLNWYK